MIYFIIYTKLAPGEPLGMISGLLEDVFTSSRDAEKAFKELQLSNIYIRKELWVKEPGGRRRILMEERYANN